MILQITVEGRELEKPLEKAFQQKVEKEPEVRPELWFIETNSVAELLAMLNSDFARGRIILEATGDTSLPSIHIIPGKEWSS